MIARALRRQLKVIQNQQVNITRTVYTLSSLRYLPIHHTSKSSIRAMSNSNSSDNHAALAPGQKITSWADKDGSFKRQVSSFRDHIEEGGKFAPEKGESCSHHLAEIVAERGRARPLPPIHQSCVPMGSSGSNCSPIERVGGDSA
jgi:hypothetical protein